MIFFAECQILVMSSTTWHQERVDNILLTTDYNEAKYRKQVKDVMHGRLHRRYNVIQCTDFDLFHSEVMHFCRISHFGPECGHVLMLRLGLGHCSYRLLHMH